MRSYEDRLKDANDKFTSNISEIRKEYEERLDEKDKTAKWKLKDVEAELVRKY